MIVAVSISPSAADQTGAVSEAVAEAVRVGLVLKADIRAGYDGQLTAKVQRIEDHLAQ